MAAGVAHEINTPLGIILGYAQLMLDDFEKNSEEYESVEIIERQTKACRRIVADLLRFSRQTESTKAPIDINAVISDVLAVTEHNLNINKITVERCFEENLPTIYGDAEKLQQVFINLINNAQYAMLKGGSLVITTSSNDQVVKVTVRDNGTGIPAEIKNKIFTPFFTTKEVGKGTGLGLSVTYGVIQEHNGSITFESPVPAEDGTEQPGTQFLITLPMYREKKTTENMSLQ
nr:MAG: hypothetical protein CSB28_01595 [Desulfobacterales bacterium]